MTPYWVSFECWSPAGDHYVVSPHAWVRAESPEHAEILARKKLGEQVHAGLAMTTCVPFSEEDYQKELKRQSEVQKRKGYWMHLN